jgi:3'-phosphoadenosine 5'-phosphosulfate (PAPS) 3'-phosphatase
LLRTGKDEAMTDATSDIDIALAAAAAGAAVVRAAYGTDSTRHPKSGLDFATDTDLEAERAIFEVIAQARPQDTRIGEESGETLGGRNRRWLVDPLSGTLNFAAQTPLFAVNVALLDGWQRSPVSALTRSRRRSSGQTGTALSSAGPASTRPCSLRRRRASSMSGVTAPSISRSSGHN